MSDQKATEKNMRKQYKTWSCGFCVCVCEFYHRNQDSDYNDSTAVCVFLKELSPEMLKTTKINSKVPKKPPQFTFKPITLDVYHL